VSDRRDIPAEAFGVTINCVLAPSLVPTQHILIRQAPRAVHFCDTPILDAGDRFRSILPLMYRRVRSLEDWPLMPNLAYIASRARDDSGRAGLSVEHFGIPGHFFSLYRTVHGGWELSGRRLERQGAAISGCPRPGLEMTWFGPKQFARAKVALRARRFHVEDFHQVESRLLPDPEVLYRRLTDDGVAYFLGPSQLSVHRVRPELLSDFEPYTDRQQVHELDKFLGLSALFRSVLAGRRRGAYSYVDSAKDAVAARHLDRATRTWLW
jgi:hypothetical protein